MSKRRPSKGRKGYFSTEFVAMVMMLVDALRKPISMLGIDYPRFRALLHVRLTLDVRRGTSQSERAQQNPFGGGLLLTCGLNLIIGALSLFFMFFLKDEPGLAMALGLSLTMIFTTMILLVDYSTVVLDSTDLQIVGALPVPDATVYASRVAHVLVYLTLIVGSLAILPLIAGALIYNALIYVPVYLLSVVLATAWCVGLAFGAFLVAMRLFDLERFKNAFLYVQVGATVFAVTGYQVIPRLMNHTDLVKELADNFLLALLFPPLHFAALFDVARGAAGGSDIFLAVLAIVLPVIIVITTVKLAGSFVSKLSSLTYAESSSAPVRTRRSLLRETLARSTPARAGFDFFKWLSRRERHFRLQAYPIVAMSLVFGLFFALQSTSTPHPVLACGALYFVSLNFAAIILHSRFSDDYEASWLIHVTPLDKPGEFIAGAMLSLIATFVLPTFLFILIILTVVFGPSILPDAFFAAEVVLIIGLTTILIIGRCLPFSQQPSKKANEGLVGKIMLFGLLTGIAILIHLAVRIHPIVFGASMIVAAIIMILQINAVRRLKPERT